MIEFDEHIKNNIKESISVNDVIKILSSYPPEMKICTTWESTINAILEENIYKSKWGCIFLDADGNSYKKEYQE